MDLQEKQNIDMAKQGDREAFKRLISPYRNRGLGLCYKLTGNMEDAKDVLQDTFIKAYVNIGKFRYRSSFFTWLYRIMINTVNDHYRKMKKRRYPERDMHENIADKEQRFDTFEIREYIEDAVKHLSDKQRAVFIMRHYDGMKMDEIAGILGCRVSTVKVHLLRAVRNLRKQLSPYFGAGS